MSLAPALLKVTPRDRFTFIPAWAAARVGIGIAVSILCGMAVGGLQHLGLPGTAAWLGVMLATRYGLWWYAARLIQARHAPKAGAREHLWVSVGVCASFAVDAAFLLSGADNCRFWCQRPLDAVRPQEPERLMAVAHRRHTRASPTTRDAPGAPTDRMRAWPSLKNVVTLWAVLTAGGHAAYVVYLGGVPADDLVMASTLGFRAVVGLIVVGLPAVLFLFLFLVLGAIPKHYLLEERVKIDDATSPR